MGILSCNGRRELYCCRIWLDDFSQREEEVKQSMHQQANTGQIRRRGYRCNWLSIRCRGTGGGAVVDWVVDRKIVWRTKAQSRRLGATDRCQDIDQPPRTPGRKRRNVNRCSAYRPLSCLGSRVPRFKPTQLVARGLRLHTKHSSCSERVM